MPNWCYNNITVTGEEVDIKDFCDKAIKSINGENLFRISNIIQTPEKIKNTISPSSSAVGKKWVNEHEIPKIRESKLNSILDDKEIEEFLIPCENNTPEKCEELRKEFGADNWYDWNIKNYGTKWDSEGEAFISDKSVKFHLETAWSPPEALFYKLQQIFPKLNFCITFDLEGSETCGRYQTLMTEDGPILEYEESESYYLSYDGLPIYYNPETGEYHYETDDSICEDYQLVNPFNE